LLQGFISPVHFVVAIENTSNPRCQLIHKQWQKQNFSAEPQPSMCQLYYLFNHTYMHI